MHSKLLNNLSSTQISDLKEVAERYKELDEETIFLYLWKMTYDPEYALKKTGLTDEIYMQFYKKVRNYIFEEYGKPEILGNPDTYNEEIFKALGQDKFAYCFICRKIQDVNCSYPESEKIRIGTLLNSDLSNNRFGGLRSLGLTISESQFFEEYESAVQIIGKIFSKEEKKFEITNINLNEEVERNTALTEENNSLLIELFTKCVSNKSKVLNFFTILNDICEKYDTCDQNLIEDKESFIHMYKLLENIKNTGISVNWLIKNKNSIEQLLS